MTGPAKVLLEKYLEVLNELRTKSFETLDPSSVPYGFVVWPDGSFAKTGVGGHVVTAKEHENGDHEALQKILARGGARIVFQGSEMQFEYVRITNSARRTCMDLAAFYRKEPREIAKELGIYKAMVDDYMVKSGIAKKDAERAKAKEADFNLILRTPEFQTALRTYSSLTPEQKQSIIRRTYLMLKVGSKTNLKEILTALSKTIKAPGPNMVQGAQNFVDIFKQISIKARAEDPDFFQQLAQTANELASSKKK